MLTLVLIIYIDHKPAICLIARAGEHAWIGRQSTVGCPDVGYGRSHAITSTEAVVAGNWMADYAMLVCLGFDPSRAFPFLTKQGFSYLL